VNVHNFDEYFESGEILEEVWALLRERVESAMCMCPCFPCYSLLTVAHKAFQGNATVMRIR